MERSADVAVIGGGKEPLVKRVWYGTAKFLESQSPEAWGNRIDDIIKKKVVPKLPPQQQEWAAKHQKGIREAATYVGVGITTAEIVGVVALTKIGLDRVLAPFRERADQRKFLKYLMTPEGTDMLLEMRNPLSQEWRDDFQKNIHSIHLEDIKKFNEVRDGKINRIHEIARHGTHRKMAEIKEKMTIRRSGLKGTELRNALEAVGKPRPKIPESPWPWQKQIRTVIETIRKNADDPEIQEAIERVARKGAWRQSEDATERAGTSELYQLIQFGLSKLPEGEWKRFAPSGEVAKVLMEDARRQGKNSSQYLAMDIADKWIEQQAPGLSGLYKLLRTKKT